jgi:hypothetical protein
MSSALEKLKKLTTKISSYEVTRKKNIEKLKKLYMEIGIYKKVDHFSYLFDFKAINLSGVSLLSENLGEVQKGKYLQILAIYYDKNASVKNKNISIGYFGRVEKVDTRLKNKIVEFVLRYRFEKSFMTLEHYNTMLELLDKK